ncbi:MAG: Rne/Rng family ribonuclease [Pseudomonadota bacterium]
MSKKMLIDAAHAEEVRVCVLENRKVEDFDFESSSRKPLRGNIYLARVTRVEPSLQAAFVEYGGNRHGFLAFNEIHPDYYQIPVSDREALQAADAEEAALAAELDLVQRGDEEDDDEDRHAYAHDDSDDDGAVEEVSADEETDEPDADDVRAEAQSIDDTEIGDDDSRDEEEEEENADDDERVADDNAEEDSGDNVDPSAEDASDDEAASENDAPEAELVAAADDGGDQPIPFVTPIFPFVAASADEETPDTDADDANADKEEETPAVDPRTTKRVELLERYKEAKRKRARLLRNYKIQEVIKRRQILLIQVVKEERGNKGAALTTYMSLAGRYCVLMPNTARGGGISRKIPNASDRKRLRRVVDSLDVPQGMGLIIRTAGAKRTKTEIKRDYDYLIRLWENIRSLTLESIAPCLIYEEASLIKRAIRDLYDKDISKVLVEGEEGYREAKDFMKMLMPSHAKNVQPYKDKLPLFVKHDVEKQLDAMYQPSVRLKSGGYLVINQTEALIAVDVNSGKATRERNIELTALKTNLEAAVETARQCRLRDLAGLIVIDFIDMEENKNNRAVEKKLKEALKHDRARIQVGRISGFGLLEMSRQRRRSGIVDGTTHACPTCNGAGAVRSNEMAALRILRAVESEAISRRAAIVSVKASLDVTLYVLNYKRAWLKRIEDDYAVSIEVIADQSKAGDQYDIEKRGEPKPRPVETSVVRADLSDAMADEDEDATSEAAADESEDEKPARRKRRRRRKKRQDDDGAEAQRGDDAVDEDDAPVEDSEREEEARASDDEDSGERKKRRRRGRRGGRRKNKRTAEDANGEASPDAGDGEEAAASETNADEAAADAGAFDEAPAASPSSADDTIDQPTADEPVSDEEASAEPEAETVEDAESGVAPIVADAPPTADEIAERVKKRKSSKKGWWSRALGG